VDAQLTLDHGRTTLAQTEALWAASRKHGATDVQRFGAARTAWDEVTGACSSASATSGTAPAALQACVSRQAAVRAVAAKGAEVNAQWAAHLVMMAHKASTDGAAYSRRWRQMVQEAPPVLRTTRVHAATWTPLRAAMGDTGPYRPRRRLPAPPSWSPHTRWFPGVWGLTSPARQRG
jgi:hypothetical protein